METKVLEQDVVLEWTGKNRGIASSQSSVLTFEIQGVSERESLVNSQFQSIYSKYATDRTCMRLEDYSVPLWGDGHNLYPQEVEAMTGEHKLIPQLIQKQVDFLFGKGPRLFQE